uniref:Putative capsid protein n=1 Tax=viral metagenome TaxID=1070528 RepID=A0A6M3XRT4_9ZZZZ
MATTPTRSQVHVDAAMSNISIAYRNANYIGPQVFPIVPVQKQSDKYFIFDKADWFRNEAGPRAPGTRGPVVEYSLSTGTYACEEIAAAKIVTDEAVENADNPLRPRQEAVEFATDKVMLNAEATIAGVVFGAGWTSSATPGTTWDDDASDPITDVEVGKETVVGLIGREANTMVIGRNVWTDLKQHPDLLDRIKYTQTGIMTPELLRQLFGVEKLLIGNAIYDSGVESPTTSSYGFLWGKHAWLGYVSPTPGLMTPSAGYLITWKNRVVERYRMDIEKADFVRVIWNYVTKSTAADAGYLFKSCVA